jgi:hypothetical protein
LAEKMNKYGNLGSLGCTSIALGCGGSILVFFILATLVSSMADTFFRGVLMLVVLALSIGIGIAIFAGILRIPDKDSKKEDEEVKKYVTSKLNVADGNTNAEKEIIILCRATYFGGHKKYAEKSDVDFVLAKQGLLIKELPGHAQTRIEIPYSDITDFGIASKDQLTVTRLLLVGILAFALKKQDQYLYIKYKDQMGFENNPVIGEFFGSTIAAVNSELYALIEQAKSGLNS